MDKRLIAAGVLSVIGAGIPAFFFGLSFYTIAFLPAFIIVLVFNIWGGQRTKAVWLAFLLYLFIISLKALPILSLPGRAVLLQILTIIAFVLVIAAFLRGQDMSHKPSRQLAVLAGIFILLTVVFLITEKIWFIKVFYGASEKIREHTQLNWPFIILSTSFQVVVAVCISVLLFIRERFTFYSIAPIFLIYNLLVALDKILHFKNDHLSTQEIISYLTTTFRIGTEVIRLVFDIHVFLTLIIAIYFFRNYTKETEKHSR